MRKDQKHLEITKRQISQKLKGKRCSPATEFKKGHIPWNKDISYRQWNSGQFKRGHRSKNWKPVGTITIRIDNRDKEVRFIKVSEPKKWEYYSRYIWMQVRKREIPKGFVIYHLDGNQLNDNPDNLICIPRSLLVKFQEADLKNFKKKRLKNASVALKKRWQEFRLTQGVL